MEVSHLNSEDYNLLNPLQLSQIKYLNSGLKPSYKLLAGAALDTNSVFGMTLCLSTSTVPCGPPNPLRLILLRLAATSALRFPSKLRLLAPHPSSTNIPSPTTTATFFADTCGARAGRRAWTADKRARAAEGWRCRGRGCCLPSSRRSNWSRLPSGEESDKRGCMLGVFWCIRWGGGQGMGERVWTGGERRGGVSCLFPRGLDWGPSRMPRQDRRPGRDRIGQPLLSKGVR